MWTAVRTNDGNLVVDRYVSVNCCMEISFTPVASLWLQAEPCSGSEVTGARPGPLTLAPQSLQLLLLGPGIITAPQKRAGV